MIPKVIHYCWFGGNPLPQIALDCIDSWRKFCPDYEIKEWNESNFSTDEYPYMKQALEYKAYAFVTDMVRLVVLYKFGGIYLDTDVKLLRPIDDLLLLEGFAGRQKGWPYRFGRHYEVATGLGIGAEAGNPIIYDMLNEYRDLHFVRKDGTLDKTPCPERNTRVLLKRGFIDKDVCQNLDGFRIFSSEYFAPKDYITGKTKITKNTYSIHLYEASWMNGKINLKNSIVAFRCRKPVMLISYLIASVLQFFKNAKADGNHISMKRESSKR